MATSISVTALAAAIKYFRGRTRDVFDEIYSLFGKVDIHHLSGYSLYKVGAVTWTGGLATLATTISGLAATDKVIWSIRVKPTQAAYQVRAICTTNTLTVELSAANSGNDCQFDYWIYRPIA